MYGTVSKQTEASGQNGHHFTDDIFKCIYTIKNIDFD